MKNKIILDLCGGTGSWSKPYKDAGYDVRIITLPEQDVCAYIPPKNVYGILAAPPCTMFSFARTNAILPRDLKLGMETVIACMTIIWNVQYKLENNNAHKTTLKFWALENPYNGFLRRFLGTSAYTFQPYDFGDKYKKHTALWVYFNEPIKNPINLNQKELSLARTNSQKLPSLGGHDKYNKGSSWKRSITPQGFARAFFERNR